ncbi:1795_t:CDS:2, partial [Gigaspora margarita]
MEIQMRTNIPQPETNGAQNQNSISQAEGKKKENKENEDTQQE